MGMERKMFDEKQDRYITRGIKELGPMVYLNLWTLIDTMDAKELDYLQVFQLKTVPGQDHTQIVIHSQECPSFKKKYVYQTTSPKTAKVYVIDDTTHSTMLLASEY